MASRAPPPPLPTTQPPPPTVRPDRFRRVLVSTFPRGPVTTPGEDAADIPPPARTSAWPWPTPPSPVDFDAPAARQASRTRAVKRHVRRTKAKGPTADSVRSRTTTDAWPTLSPVTHDPPPSTQAEREYQQLRRRHDAAEARLKTLYADVHLRLYVLGLLRPADYSELGLEGALDAWVGELGGEDENGPRLSSQVSTSSGSLA